MPTLFAPPNPDIRHHSSPLGEWQLGAWGPPDLAAVVESMWYFDGTLAWPRERIFPQGRHELIVHLGDVYRELRDGGADAYPRVCATGQQLRSLVIEAPCRRTAVLGIRLTPAGAFAVLGAPVHELTGVTADLGALLGPEAEALADRCAAAPDGEARLRVAAAWIRGRLARGVEADAAVSWAAGIIDDAAGRVSVTAVRERTGWSRTRFTRTFREQVGLTPKMLARIARFRRALGMLHQDGRRLSAVAHACGYSDQPHFNAEFREFAGSTPGAYRSALRYPNSASLAEGGTHAA